MCNTVHDESYVFIRSTFNQSRLSYKLDQILSDSILESSSNCSGMVKTLLCNYFLPLCGTDQAVYVPRAVCPEQCFLVQNSCMDVWDRVNTVIAVNEDLGVIDCNAPQKLLSSFPACCIELPAIGVQGNVTTPLRHASHCAFVCIGTSAPSGETTLPAPTNQVGMAVGIAIAIIMSLLALLLIVIVAVLYIISSKRKKVTLRRLQLDILARY